MTVEITEGETNDPKGVRIAGCHSMLGAQPLFSTTFRETRMPTAIDRLRELEERLGRVDEDEFWSRGEVSFTETSGLIAVDYYGYYSEEALQPVFETLCLPEVAEALGALSFAGEDDGANGTKDWDFTPLLKRKITFPHLHTLSVELYDRQNHNHPIVASGGYEESGQLARWLDRAPQLTTLSAPSAPDGQFFQRPARPLRVLRVQAGYATQRFIPNLARSTCFPGLQELDWTEVEAIDQDAEFEYNRSLDRQLGHSVDEPTMRKLEKLNEELKEEGAPTSFEQFEALLRSTACPPKVTLRDPILTSDQIALLKTIFRTRHPEGSLSIVSPHEDPHWSPLNRKNWRQ